MAKSIVGTVIVTAIFKVEIGFWLIMFLKSVVVLIKKVEYKILIVF